MLLLQLLKLVQNSIENTLDVIVHFLRRLCVLERYLRLRL